MRHAGKHRALVRHTVASLKAWRQTAGVETQCFSKLFCHCQARQTGIVSVRLCSCRLGVGHAALDTLCERRGRRFCNVEGYIRLHDAASTMPVAGVATATNPPRREHREISRGISHLRWTTASFSKTRGNLFAVDAWTRAEPLRKHVRTTTFDATVLSAPRSEVRVTKADLRMRYTYAVT